MHVQVSLKHGASGNASLTQMEQQIQEAGQQAMREALKQAVRHWENRNTTCPQCGHQQRRLEGTVRRTIATVFGRVQVQRRRFRCQHCQHRWCPANGLFAELKGGTISVPLQEAAMLAGCSWPYRVASSTLKRLSGAHISVEEIRLLTNRHGKQRALQQQAEAEQACSSQAEEAPPAQNAEQPMLVGLDGGWVCSREQRGGMEGKVAVVCSRMEELPMHTSSSTFSWSERGVPRYPPRQRHRLVQRRYVATFGPSRQLGSQAKAAAQLLCDDPSAPGGGHSRWGRLDQEGTRAAFPSGDLYSGLGHLWREVSHAFEWRRAPSRSQRNNEITSCTCTASGSGMVGWIKPCKACVTWERTAS